LEAIQTFLYNNNTDAQMGATRPTRRLFTVMPPRRRGVTVEKLKKS